MEGLLGETEINVFDREYDGILWRGALTPENLLKEIGDSFLLLYPNVYPETSCIVAHMAISCGTPVITSDFGALPEIINSRNGVLIKDTPRNNSDYKKQFLEAFNLLIKEKNWQKRHEYCLRYKLSWNEVAKEWNDFFNTNEILRGTFKILVGVPTRKKRTAAEQQHVKELEPPVGGAIQYLEIPGKDIATAREDICDYAVDHSFDYVLFVDDDNIVPLRTIKILYETGADLVSLNYFKKLMLSQETAGYTVNTLEDARISKETLSEVYVAGMGCTLIHTKILKIIGKPYFKNTYLNPEPGGEDIYFFGKCRTAGIKPYILNGVWALHRDVKTGRLFGPDHLINKNGKSKHSWMIDEYAGLQNKDLYNNDCN